jgi:hypothetical protein
MPRLTSTQFMHALPAATRAQLPAHLRTFKSVSRGWLCQLYYREARLHYEVWNMGERRGLIEIGLHFESRDRARNSALLAGFDRHMVEVKATLGPRWEAEPWDKGWTKVYETVPYEPFTDELLARIAARLARSITVLQPIWEELRLG